VGKSIGKFLSIEVKSENGRVLESQTNWQRMIENMGGYGIIVKEIDDVNNLLK